MRHRKHVFATLFLNYEISDELWVTHAVGMCENIQGNIWFQRHACFWDYEFVYKQACAKTYKETYGINGMTAFGFNGMCENIQGDMWFQRHAYEYRI